MARPSLVTSSGGPRELAEAARLAEAAGFESVWATEFYDRSATVGLAAMAEATTTIELGSAIAYAFGRTPVVLAAEARDLDELSGWAPDPRARYRHATDAAGMARARR